MGIEAYDPPMCCPTGICGPNVDVSLIQFAADLEWLQERGVDVRRYNLTQQPEAFTGTALVKEALEWEGNGCLPLILADGEIVHRGEYPSREILAGYAGIAIRTSLFTDAVRELVAIGAAIGSNCEICFKHQGWKGLGPGNAEHQLGFQKPLPSLGRSEAATRLASLERRGEATVRLAELVLGGPRTPHPRPATVGGSRCFIPKAT